VILPPTQKFCTGW